MIWSSHSQYGLYHQSSRFRPQTPQDALIAQRLEEAADEIQTQYWKSLYPEKIKKIQQEIEHTCDELDYAGSFIYDEYPDPIASSLEIGRRGYECVIKKSKKFYPDKIPYTKIQDRWKETDFSGISDWKELHALLKNSKMKYRIPVPDRTVFKIFSSHKSQVYSL